MSPRDRPTLEQLRARVFKPGPRQLGNWLAIRVGRPLAIHGTWLAVRLGLSANQVTLGALVAVVGSAVAIGTGTRSGFVAGVALGYLAFWLDHVDGQVARWRGEETLGGVYFDYLLHHAQALLLGFAIGFGLTVRTGQPGWSVAGFSAAVGWLFLSLHNDCRYKAVFHRLKLDGRRYLFEPASAERPSPPAGWPRRGRGILTWPAYKSCEPHVVLLTLTALAGLAVLAPVAWPIAWGLYVLLMAVAAPLLALARSARVVVQDTPGRDFELWFPPHQASQFSPIGRIPPTHSPPSSVGWFPQIHRALIPDDGGGF